MMTKTIVITGASDGIGAYAARCLKNLGHNVIIVGRNKEKTEKIARELNFPFFVADYSVLNDVVNLAKELNKLPKIDVLINNAGGVLKKEIITDDGFEKTFQVNLLAPFLLTKLLMEKLSLSKAIVIQTSSIAANMYKEKKNFSAINAYALSKLYDVIFTRELFRRYKDIYPVAFEPGVPRTNFGAEGNFFLKLAYHSPLKYLFTISKKRSSKRMLRLALGKPNTDFECGQTYSYKKIYKVKFNNEEKEKELWDKWENMISCLHM